MGNKYNEQAIKDALKKSGELWNSTLKIDLKNDSDQKDLLFHIHAIQNLLYANLYIEQNGKV